MYKLKDVTDQQSGNFFKRLGLRRIIDKWRVPQETLGDDALILQDFLDKYYGDYFVVFDLYHPREQGKKTYEQGKKYVCEIRVNSRIYKAPRIVQMCLGDDRKALAALSLEKLEAQRKKEEQEETNASKTLVEYIEENYFDFEVVCCDLFKRFEFLNPGESASEHGIPAQRYLVIVQLDKRLPEYNRCGDFCLTRAQGCTYEQASRKALELLKFKEDNDLLYMNEFIGYYKPEPAYYDRAYRGQILTDIKKGSIVIPIRCLDRTIKYVLDQCSSSIQLTDVPATPTEPTGNPMKQWISNIVSSRSRTTSPSSSTPTTPTDENQNPFSGSSFGSFGLKFPGRRASLPGTNTLTKELQEKRNSSKGEKRGVPRSSTAPASQKTASSSITSRNPSVSSLIMPSSKVQSTSSPSDSSLASRISTIAASSINSRNPTVSSSSTSVATTAKAPVPDRNVPKRVVDKQEEPTQFKGPKITTKGSLEHVKLTPKKTPSPAVGASGVVNKSTSVETRTTAKDVRKSPIELRSSSKNTLTKSQPEIATPSAQPGRLSTSTSLKPSAKAVPQRTSSSASRSSNTTTPTSMQSSTPSKQSSSPPKPKKLVPLTTHQSESSSENKKIRSSS